MEILLLQLSEKEVVCLASAYGREWDQLIAYTLYRGSSLIHPAVKEHLRGDTHRLRSILLRVSSLVTGEDIQTNQVGYEDVVFVTQTIRMSVHAATLASVASRCNAKTAMLPVGAGNRRARRMMGRLTGGRAVDMKDKSHNVCVP